MPDAATHPLATTWPQEGVCGACGRPARAFPSGRWEHHGRPCRARTQWLWPIDDVGIRAACRFVPAGVPLPAEPDKPHWHETGHDENGITTGLGWCTGDHMPSVREFLAREAEEVNARCGSSTWPTPPSATASNPAATKTSTSGNATCSTTWTARRGTGGWEVTDTRCDRTELLVDQCACPQHRGGDVDDRPETVGQPFEAAYTGVCPLCEHRIHVGDLIRRLADDDGYVHAGRCTP